MLDVSNIQIFSLVYANLHFRRSYLRLVDVIMLHGRESSVLLTQPTLTSHYIALKLQIAT
jgi:hypothetical protein